MPFGWLAVLLAYLGKNSIIRARLKSRLESGTLDQLLSAVTEFASYHQRVANELSNNDPGIDVKANFTQRLQDLVDDLRAEEKQVNVPFHKTS